jgi:hypothetical protein
LTTIADLQNRVHRRAVDKGWWNAERTVGDLIALMHSELTEALEEFRQGRLPDEIYYTCHEVGPDGNEVRKFTASSREECGGASFVRPEGVAVQLGDCIIRILDFCGRWGIDLESLLDHKVAYNEKFRYGSKVL